MVSKGKTSGQQLIVFIIDHKFSIGFKSGGFGGQTIRVLVTNYNSARNFVVVFPG